MITPAGLLSVQGVSKAELLPFFKRLEKERPKQVEGSGMLAFFEPSTRTRVSFERAGHLLGIQWIQFQESDLSLQKGESLRDTFEALALYRPDFLVVRHRESGFAHLVHHWTKRPVINAGDGQFQHPTQGLLDGYTLWKRDPKRRYKIAFFGDVVRSRVVRSDIPVFRALGYDLSVVSDGTDETALFARAFQMPVISRENLAGQDVVVALRVQKERGSAYKLSALSMNDLGEKTLWMHPGPVMIGLDLDYELCEKHERNLISEQVQNGLTVRTLLLSDLVKLTKKRTKK